MEVSERTRSDRKYSRQSDIIGEWDIAVDRAVPHAGPFDRDPLCVKPGCALQIEDSRWYPHAFPLRLGLIDTTLYGRCAVYRVAVGRTVGGVIVGHRPATGDRNRTGGLGKAGED